MGGFDAGAFDDGPAPDDGASTGFGGAARGSDAGGST